MEQKLKAFVFRYKYWRHPLIGNVVIISKTLKTARKKALKSIEYSPNETKDIIKETESTLELDEIVEIDGPTCVFYWDGDY